VAVRHAPREDWAEWVRNALDPPAE